jgi:hypothetical protein
MGLYVPLLRRTQKGSFLEESKPNRGNYVKPAAKSGLNISGIIGEATSRKPNVQQTVVFGKIDQHSIDY